ncbi:CLUMA_CG003030, isoform A [Clunio marinus]|uniref:CLUMA_CG003030, isoform A n=1 Tax=Clunio marinus TaxID=568069 RepID=A0A1J1HMJ5_9DIPT|nr:CLUMA_CG003030, isoform A [Clunio marinus]
MKINEKTLFTFANSKPVDKEGYLMKRGEVNKAFQRRWFVLKGNLLFYFEKKGGELLGMIILEGCVIELSETETEKYCFNINFIGNRSYVLSAEDQDSLESWMRALTCSGFDYMRLMVSELQRQLEELDKQSMASSSSDSDRSIPVVPPRRQNPFNKAGNENLANNIQQVVPENFMVLREAPPPPVNRRNFDSTSINIIKNDNEFLMFEPEKDDFTFEKLHEEFGRSILLELSERRQLKESLEKPLILF